MSSVGKVSRIYGKSHLPPKRKRQRRKMRWRQRLVRWVWYRRDEFLAANCLDAFFGIWLASMD